MRPVQPTRLPARLTRGLAAFCLMSLLATLTLTGCTGVWTGSTMPDPDNSSVSTERIEIELIPNAKLVREDTSPRWPLGRYAFDKGVDHLLVISRITALRPTELGSNKKQELRDHTIERVWLTIPYGTDMGQQIKLEDLEQEFLAGYDAGNLGDGAFIQPIRLQGYIQLIDLKDSTAVADINVLIEPQRLPTWNVRGYFDAVPVAKEGLQAKRVDAARQLAVRPPRAGTNSLTRTTPQTIDNTSDASTDVATTDQPDTADGAGNGEPPEQVPSIDDNDPLAGKWRGQSPSFEVRLQIIPSPEPRFAMASYTRNSPQPLLREGQYRVKGDYLILQVERLENARNPAAEPSHLVLRMKLEPDNLTLDGNFGAREGAMRMVMQRGEFADMLPTQDQRVEAE